MFVGGAGEFSSIALVSVGQVLDPGTFTGGGALGNGSNTTFNGTGTQYVGFRSGANLGWFKVSFTDMGPIVYSTGQFANNGERLFVGGIPEPATGALGLLALGAMGIRRKRNQN